MNHNSFPSGEQAPGSQDNEESTEFLSFEEHMQNINQQNNAEWNTTELTKPSMKNTELPEGSMYITKGIEDISKKLKNGEPLNGSDIASLAEDCTYGVSREELSGFLVGSGLGDGKDFDVKLPATITLPDGASQQTPLSISFRNNRGDFTRIDISRNPANSKVEATSYSGKAEDGVDVGYDGPVKAIPDSRRDFKMVTFEE